MEIPAAPPQETSKDNLFRGTQIIALDPNTGAREVIVAHGHSPRISPDGKQLAFLRTGYAAKGGIAESLYLLDLDKPQSIRKVCDAHWFAGWDHTGRGLAIKTADARDDGGLHLENQMVDSISGSRSKLPLAQQDIIADCSPTSNLLLASQGEPVIDPHLYTVGGDGNEQKKIAPGEFSGRFSPDGRQIAFVRHHPPFTARICDLDGKLLKDVFVGIDRAWPANLCWSPDGKFLAFTAYESDGVCASLFIVTTSGEVQKELKLEGDSGKIDWK